MSCAKLLRRGWRSWRSKPLAKEEEAARNASPSLLQALTGFDQGTRTAEQTISRIRFSE